MFSQALLSRFVFAVAMLGVVFAAPVSAQNVKESFTGFAINMDGVVKTATIDFTITRWSTDAERTKLLDLLHVRRHENTDRVRPARELVKDGRLHRRGLITIDQRNVDHVEALQQGHGTLGLDAERLAGGAECAAQRGAKPRISVHQDDEWNARLRRLVAALISFVHHRRVPRVRHNDGPPPLSCTSTVSRLVVTGQSRQRHQNSHILPRPRCCSGAAFLERPFPARASCAR